MNYTFKFADLNSSLKSISLSGDMLILLGDSEIGVVHLKN